MTTMTFFANRAARNAKLTGNVDLSSLTEMLPVLLAALLCVVALNTLV